MFTGILLPAARLIFFRRKGGIFMIEQLNQIETKAREIKELYKRLQALIEKRNASIEELGNPKEILKLVAESIMLEMSIDCIKCYIETGGDIETFNFAEEIPEGKNVFNIFKCWDSYPYNSITREFFQNFNKDSITQLVYLCTSEGL